MKIFGSFGCFYEDILPLFGRSKQRNNPQLLLLLQIPPFWVVTSYMIRYSVPDTAGFLFKIAGLRSGKPLHVLDADWFTRRYTPPMWPYLEKRMIACQNLPHSSSFL